MVSLGASFMPKKTYLLILIEDDANDVLLFQKAIAKSGLDVELVVLRDGEKAISYLSGETDPNVSINPDLVLLDLKLPRKSGFEVLEWIKNHPNLHTTPVVILSSSKQTQDVDHAYKLGANSYLVKPTGFTELNHLISDLGSYWFEHNQTLKTR
jgi:DNA-binding response OmpR family regulator